MNDFIAIDFETAMNERNSAISIGLVKYYNYQAVDSYYSLIRPPNLYIRPDFSDIHGLTVDDVKDSPDFKYLWDHGISAFLERLPLAAHYAPFDMSVLRAVLEWHEIPIPDLPYFCTCTMARLAWPGLESYSLSALAKHFGIVYNAHHALDDAETCGKLVKMAAEKFGERKSIEEMLAAAGVRMLIANNFK